MYEVSAMKLLIAEDQVKLLNILTERLKNEGYVVDAVNDGQKAIDFLEHSLYDCVILDIMMPHQSGLDVLRWLRNQNIQTPVIFLTAKDDVSDRVIGLKSGADDYLIKPFAFEELKERIKVLLKRRPLDVKDLLTVGDLTLDRTTKKVIRQNQEIVLTKKEYNVLEALMLRAGEVLSRERLENIVSTMDYEGYSNVIDVYIRFLRKKIDDPFESKLIKTVRGFGYVIRRES
jgi:DNA-binding response OmpR family regulator